MPLTAAQLQTLKTEILTDPNAYGYAAPYSSGADGAVADLLNQVRGTITVRRRDINPVEILEAVDTRDLPSTASGGTAWFESATQAPSLRLLNDDGTDTRVLANFKRVLTNTQGSTTRLNQIANRTGSRAEQLFGTDAVVTADDVSKTRLI